MNETLAFIEKYFTKSLSPDEVATFENRCVNDTAFAEEVATYITMRDTLKQTLHKQKSEEFEALHKVLNNQNSDRGLVRKMAPWIAAVAACLLLFFGYIIYFSKPSSRQLASNYIDKNFSTIGITMGNSKDSLQQGIAAYNQKNFSEAGRIFQSLRNGPQHSEAIKYSGIVFLKTGNYNQAIAQFDALANDHSLYSNPGLFYKALALLKRAGAGDKIQARNLLNEVIRKELPGAKEAKEIMATL